MPTDRLSYLIERFFKDGCSDDERQELALWIDTLENEEEWKMLLEKTWENPVDGAGMDSSAAERIILNIFEEERVSAAAHARPRSRIQGMYKLSVAAAAVIGLLIALSVIYVNKNFRPAAHPAAAESGDLKNDVGPGGNKAVLVLANGREILLDSAKNGALVQLGNMKVSKVDNGELAFRADQAGGGPVQSDPAPLWNTLRTPSGGQYRITLPDGSRAWLNAASSIRFPSAFGSGTRQVEASGEVYFEIAPDAEKPFLVKVVSDDGKAMGQVSVLGTSFNINAYTDEAALKTTLLRGKVKVENPGRHQPVTLYPGQQAALDAEGNTRVSEGVNTEEVVAWKNGLFDFEGNDIQSVMRQIARWYNVEVQYEHVTSAHFMGTISRSVNLSEVLKMLELTGTVHFRISGRTVTVSG